MCKSFGSCRCIRSVRHKNFHNSLFKGRVGIHGIHCGLVWAILPVALEITTKIRANGAGRVQASPRQFRRRAALRSARALPKPGAWPAGGGTPSGLSPVSCVVAGNHDLAACLVVRREVPGAGEGKPLDRCCYADGFALGLYPRLGKMVRVVWPKIRKPSALILSRPQTQHNL